jgi:hypothetical protein
MAGVPAMIQTIPRGSSQALQAIVRGGYCITRPTKKY